MKDKKNIIRLLGTVLLLGTVATACYDYEEYPLVKLAALENEIIMEADGGIFSLRFYANSPSFHVECLQEADWLTVTTDDPIDGMATLTGNCARNVGFKRKVDMVLCSDLTERRDTVVVKQRGADEAFLEFDEPSVIVPGAGGITTSTVRTNIPFEEMNVEIVYQDAANSEWVRDLDIADSEDEERTIRFVTSQNTDEETPRTAIVTISYIDGWDEAISVQFTLLQCNANEEVGLTVSFEEFRNSYVNGGTIYDYILLSGIVVSNKDEGNAGEPEQVTTSTINFTPTTTTVYLESEDGRYGIDVKTATEDDNIFEQFDHVTLLLYGAAASLEEENPPCYRITGLERSMVVSRTSGTANDVPIKERYIEELTDDDIYTYVKLKDVEFPIRKGGLYPVDGGLSATCGTSQRITKYPVVIRDIKGGYMYLLTNDRCPYNRDGTRLPNGSGNIYGVIVHEHDIRTEWRNGADPADIYTDETLANIGRYSIRHQTKEDIWGEMNDNFKDGFSAFICEYRWRVIKDKLDVPSYGTNGWLTHTYQTAYSGSSAKNYTNSNGTHFTGAYRTFDYLGPGGHGTGGLYGKNIGNKNGIGIIVDPDNEDYTTYLPDRFAYNRKGELELGCEFAENQYCGYGTTGWTEAVEESYTDEINNSSASDNTGKAWINANAYLSFSSQYWWDDDTGRPYGYLVYFSTKGISSDVVSMQLYIRGSMSSGYTPRYWCAEWALTDSQAEKDDGQWNMIGEFTVNDCPNWNSPNLFASPGYKQMNFPLTTDILNHDDVYIRIRPTSDLCSDTTDYANAHLKDSASGSALAAEHRVDLAYFAVRYNK